MTEDVQNRRGDVTTEPDGRRRLEFRRSWPDPIEDVWAALTEPERLARWIGVYAGGRGPGGTGTFAMTHEEGEPVGEPMTIVECDPPRRLVVQWNQQQEGSFWRIDLDLWTEQGRTVLRFLQVFPADTDVADFAMGWHWYLAKLAAEIAGSPGPGDWDAFYAEIGPSYGRAPVD